MKKIFLPIFLIVLCLLLSSCGSQPITSLDGIDTSTDEGRLQYYITLLKYNGIPYEGNTVETHFETGYVSITTNEKGVYVDVSNDAGIIQAYMNDDGGWISDGETWDTLSPSSKMSIQSDFVDSVDRMEFRLLQTSSYSDIKLQTHDDNVDYIVATAKTQEGVKFDAHLYFNSQSHQLQKAIMTRLDTGKWVQFLFTTKDIPEKAPENIPKKEQ